MRWPFPTVPLTRGRLGFHAGPLPGEPADATFTTVAGARVHYVDLGTGPAVVLLHGFASSLEVWSRLLPQLARGFPRSGVGPEGLRVDRPSRGRLLSARAGGAGLGAARRARGRAGRAGGAFLGRLGGAGNGARRAGADHPHRAVRRLGLRGTAAASFSMGARQWARESLLRFYDDSWVRSRLVLGFHDPRHVTPELARSVESRMALPGTRAATLAAMRGMHFAGQQTRYATLRAPALILWGQEDTIAAPAFGERLASDLGGELVVFPRCGHFPMIEVAEASNATLERFLRAGATGG